MKIKFPALTWHDYYISIVTMNPITERILSFNEDRLPDKVQLKYEAMTESFFRFYRGTNHIFYEDLNKAETIPSSPISWICGDLHLENFGSFKSDNRQVYFDLNDFDEGILAPVILESYRMVTSIFVAFDSLGIESEKADHLAKLYLKKYSSCLSCGKAEYIEPNTATGIVKHFLNAVALRRQRDILNKKTVEKRNKLEILLDDPRHIELKKKEKASLIDQVTEWLKNDGDSPYNYRVTDAVFRIAGTGSLGLKRYAALLKSRNENGEKYLLLDIKQAIPSSLTPYVDNPQPGWATEAGRVVQIQWMMQNRTPALMSSMEFEGISYIVEEIQPTKDKINFKLLKKDYRHMIRVVSDMATLAASSQLRSSGRKTSATAEELIEFGNRSDWQEGVIEYSDRYARHLKQEFNGYCEDVKSGWLKNKIVQGVAVSMMFFIGITSIHKTPVHSRGIQHVSLVRSISRLNRAV